MFKKGWLSVINYVHSRLSSVVTCFVVKEQVNQHIYTSQYYKIVPVMSISHEKKHCKSGVKPDKNYIIQME